jgi:hypothetical protein
MSSDRRFYVALALYAVLGILVWTTLGFIPVHVADREFDLRLVPSVILGTFALRTILVHHADRIRTEGEKRTE